MPALAVFWNDLPNWLKQTILIGGAVLLTIALGKAWVEDQKSQAVKRARDKQIARQTKETLERVEDFHEASTAVESLPDDELRERTKDDPNNRGLVRRD